MKLFEFEAKEILRQYDIPVPKGQVIHRPEEAESAAREIGSPVALKSQVLVSGRGKSGGILFANNPEEAREVSSRLIGMTIKGLPVQDILVEQEIDIAEEYYASVTIDRQAKRYVVMASTSGGVDIEEIAQTSPDKIARHHVDPLGDFDKDAAQAMIAQFQTIDKEDANKLSGIVYALYRIAMDYDAELVEINPLAKTASGDFVACDARIIIDDNALFRHCLLYTSPSPRDLSTSRMPSSA